MRDFIKRLSDGGLAEDIYDFMKRVLDEDTNKEKMTSSDKLEEYLEDCAEVGEKIKSIREDERKRVLDKACEWLKNTIDDDVFINCDSVIKIMPANEFVEYFRKIMEE